METSPGHTGNVWVLHLERQTYIIEERTITGERVGPEIGFDPLRSIERAVVDPPRPLTPLDKQFAVGLDGRIYVAVRRTPLNVGGLLETPFEQLVGVGVFDPASRAWTTLALPEEPELTSFLPDRVPSTEPVEIFVDRQSTLLIRGFRMIELPRTFRPQLVRVTGDVGEAFPFVDGDRVSPEMDMGPDGWLYAFLDGSELVRIDPTTGVSTTLCFRPHAMLSTMTEARELWTGLPSGSMRLGRTPLCGTRTDREIGVDLPPGIPIDIDSRGNLVVQVGSGYHIVSPDGDVLGSFPDGRPIFLDRPHRR